MWISRFESELRENSDYGLNCDEIIVFAAVLRIIIVRVIVLSISYYQLLEFLNYYTRILIVFSSIWTISIFCFIAEFIKLVLRNRKVIPLTGCSSLHRVDGPSGQRFLFQHLLIPEHLLLKILLINLSIRYLQTFFNLLWYYNMILK